MYFICHTTQYREGGAKFARAAETLREALLAVDPTRDVRLQVVERKAQFVAAMQAIRESGARIDELHVDDLREGAESGGLRRGRRRPRMPIARVRRIRTLQQLRHHRHGKRQ